MTIGWRTPGDWAEGSTSLSVSAPVSIASGDMMVLFVGAKPYTASIQTPSGWTRIGSLQTNGTTASGADSGSVTWGVFYKIAGASEGSTTVSVTSGNISLGCAFGFSRTMGAWITPTAYFGSDVSSGTDYSITGASSSGNLTANDMLLHASFLNGDITTATSPTLSATSLTIGTVTEAPNQYGTATGDNAAGISAYASATSGTSSADIIAGFTLGQTRTGGGVVVRLRESPTLYYVVYPSSKGTPTATQIKAGQDADGGSAIAAGSEAAPTSTQTFTFSSAATGLSGATAYKIAFVWSDGTNNSNVAESSAWATTNTGALTVTDTGDTVALSGGVKVQGTLSVSDTIDTVAFAGSTRINGTLTVSDAADTLAFAGKVIVTGTLAANDSPDAVAIAGKVIVQGTLVATDTADNVVIDCTEAGIIYGTLAVVEATDVVVFSSEGIIIDYDVAVDNNWIPDSGKVSSWTEGTRASKNWAREAR